MKKIVIALALCTLLISPQAYAGDDNIKAHISNTLSVLFQLANKKGLNANDYQLKSFVYEGMPITTVKSKTSAWVGYFKKIPANDLPFKAVARIKNRYKAAKIDKVIMYFTNEAEIKYFAEIIINNKCIVLKIQPSGNIKVFS